MAKQTSVPRASAFTRPISALELARRLGLSHATVSFVLNGIAAQQKISPATIKRVQDAAKELNCVPNPFARSLKVQRSGMIGVILPNFKVDWAEAVMEGMQKGFEGSPYIPFVTTHAFSEERNQRELSSSLQRRDDGIITLPTMGCADLYRDIAQSGLPLVFLGDEYPKLKNIISSVTWNARDSIHAAIAHLVDIGRSRIAFLGIDYPGLETLHRFEVFAAAISEHGLELKKHWIAKSHAPSKVTGEKIAALALDQFFAGKKPRPDAIFALNDALALHLLEELDARGIRVPEDIAIVGMGDLPLTRLASVSISTIPEPLALMGEMAARLLVDLIGKRVRPPVHKTIATSEFCARRTTLGS